MSWEHFLAFGFGAIITASLAYYFNKRLQESSQRWEAQKHIIETAENFCDELIRDSVSYWTTAVNRENCEQMQAQAGKISAMSTLTSFFLKENFPHDSNINQSLRKMIDSVTGSNFGSKQERDSDLERAGSATSSLIRLRLAVSHKAKA